MVLYIERDKRIVARVLPARQADGFLIEQLDDLLGKGPQLSAAGKFLMALDMRAVRVQQHAKADPWT